MRQVARRGVLPVQVEGGQPGGIVLLDEVADGLDRESGKLHIEAGEFDVASAGLVEVAHPEDHVEDLLGVPCPEVQASKKLLWVADAVEDVVVEAVGLGHISFDGEDGESLLRSQVFDDAVLELEEFARAVGSFAEFYDAGVAHDLTERLEVGKAVACFDGLQGDGVLAHPLDGGLLFRGLNVGLGGCRHGCRLGV